MNTNRANAGAGKHPMPLSTRLYIGAVIAAGALVLATFAPREVPQPLLALTFLAAMIVVSLFKLRLPLGDGQSTMSMAYVVDFAVIATAGADLAMAIAAIGVVVQCTVNVRRRQPWYRTAFSVATVVLAVRTAGLVWAALGGTVAGQSGLAAVLPLVVAAVPYFAINSGLVAAAVALSNGTSPVRCWIDNFLSTAPGVFAAAGIVAGVELTMSGDGYVLLAAVAVPAAMCHMAYAAFFRRFAPVTPATA
jgi:hypothetical protein